MRIEIDKLTLTEQFEGYTWWSDRDKPEVFNHNRYEELVFDNCANPFIVEGQLFDTQSNVSYSIRFIDGEYLIYRYDVGACSHKSDEEFIASSRLHSIDNSVEKLYFHRIWREETDSLCENMTVLTPAEMVFVGFTKR